MKRTVKSFVLAGLLLTGIVSVAGAGEMPVQEPGGQGAVASSQGAVFAGQGAVAAGQGAVAAGQGAVVAGQGAVVAGEATAAIRDEMAVRREQGLNMARERRLQALGQACNTVKEAQQAKPMAGGFQNHGSAGLRGQAMRPEVRVRPRFR